MIHLLFFIDTGLTGGGAERVLCNLVNALDHDRFDVTVATPFPEDTGVLSPRVRHQSLYPAKNRLTRYLYRLEAALGTARNRIRGDFDLEIAYLECGATKVMSASKSSAGKIAWVHCDLAKKQPDIDAFVKKSRGWYQKFDQVICVSESVRESFVKLYGEAVPVSVLYNINDEGEILKKAAAFLPEKAHVPTLCAVGRLSPEKGFDLLIEACAGLQIPFRLQIIGEGAERAHLETLIRRAKLSDRVELLGFQPNPYPYMNAADLIVCSSRFEGFSTVVTEALILGKPVITTPCAGMAELLGDSDHGLIVPPSPEGLREGITALLSDPEMLTRYRSAAQRRGKDFRKEALIQKTEEAFLKILE